MPIPTAAVVIRNNIICNDGENGIDLKGGAYVIIEGNILYGTMGNNEGGLEPERRAEP